MSKNDHYFTFPLHALNGDNKRGDKSPLEILEYCLSSGIYNAGVGYRNKYDEADFTEKLDAVKAELAYVIPENTPFDALAYYVGADLTKTRLPSCLETICYKAMRARDIQMNAPYVRMSARSMWRAIETARWLDDPTTPRPEHEISFDEFRILCAILSNGSNREGFTFIGWETIRARSCGFSTKEAFKKAKRIRPHLAPALSRAQIDRICKTLEKNRFFLRFRHSQGKVGGYMAYSFRHAEREDLARAVLAWSDFQKGRDIDENRQRDLEITLKHKETSKV